MVVADDGVFTVTVGPATSSEVGNPMEPCQSSKSNIFTPSPRINCGMAVKHGLLYLFGGIYEDGDKQYTYADFYSLGKYFKLFYNVNHISFLGVKTVKKIL